MLVSLATQVHRFVGREPSGRMFNSLALNHDNIPHNVSTCCVGMHTSLAYVDVSCHVMLICHVMSCYVM